MLSEVRQLAELGYSEVQLLGQTVNSYADPTARKMKFSELLLAVADVPGIRRVRFTTSHPRDFTPDIVEAIDAEPKVVRPRAPAGAIGIDAKYCGPCSGLTRAKSIWRRLR